MMLYRLGRALQMIGMAMLPVALYVGLIRNEVRREVMLLAIGGAIFVIGWLVAQKRP
jgi:hypothetical protein